MKLTVKILERFYEPPATNDSNYDPTFTFSPKVKSLLLPPIVLRFNAYSRDFQARPENGHWEWIDDPEEIQVLRSRLSPEQIARCVAAAIEGGDDIPF